jgi:penicillin amidase
MVNPARGWVASANEMNLPPGYPAEERNHGFEWADPCRIERIAAVLSANDKVSLDDSLALQTDIYCGSAMRGIALLRGLRSDDREVEQALRLLEAWDGRETTDSPAAAIAEVWLNKHLAPHTAAKITTPAAAELIAFGSPYAVTTYLQSPGPALGAEPEAAREAVLRASLRAALDEIAERLGPDMTAWRWGELHHARFVPPAAVLAEPDLREAMSHGPAPIPGSAFTVCAATYRMDDFAATNGSSFRMVVDVGAWDNSRWILPGGQSGNPLSPHYADQFPLWQRGEGIPIPWSDEEVEKAMKVTLRLVPKV